MKQFIIQFNFEGEVYSADVTEIGGLDDIQYAISQTDEELAERFKTNVIRKLKDAGEFQYNFPEAAGATEFMQSLEKGLAEYLQKNP